MAELESLALSTIRLNEFNDNRELRGLVKGIVAATTIATTTVAIEEYGVCSYCGKQFEEAVVSCRSSKRKNPQLFRAKSLW
jgi:hypothetical protein